eukprot:CAMPEP_0197613544 /NCGR_PEP_ID=MMETSP1326-20131121/59071_1 /TAXON_ID=1155430 /ORGANISM="Genus nov. species nov., Strain RCC2288" /LENGTH=76 /DNA_ID=CAMNT_0043182407 /DNA_START=358 /DNA_END=588 /DNA_ORIENTATION=-
MSTLSLRPVTTGEIYNLEDNHGVCTAGTPRGVRLSWLMERSGGPYQRRVLAELMQAPTVHTPWITTECAPRVHHVV